MITGFNHNFTYQKLRVHIQTEDCGVKKPRIETHLFRDGTIVATRKTSYDDILKVDDLDKVVEELMKDQHREMLRRLKNGEYDKILGVVRENQAASKDVLAGLPEEMEIGKLDLKALAPDVAVVAAGDDSVARLRPQKAVEELELKEADLIDPAEEDKGEKKKMTADPNLEEVVMMYLLGASGRGLKV
jgi:hypothetical protein